MSTVVAHGFHSNVNGWPDRWKQSTMEIIPFYGTYYQAKSQTESTRALIKLRAREGETS